MELSALVVRWTREAAATIGECMYEEMGNKGKVESIPEVVNGVRSSILLAR